MGTDLAHWEQQVRAGDVRALSRAITAIENHADGAEELLRRLFPSTGRAFLIGVTGSPGTGKSTLVDRLAQHYRKQGLSVGIIAVDPTSPFSGGAILGDRIRMQSHAGDQGVFIRSMATRGFLGGLARATADVALLLDAAGKQIILIETVGVGQDEVDIVRLADCSIVVLMPGLGDEVQALKAGIMEIADVFAINKADREGAARFEEQLLAMLHLAPLRDGWSPPVQRTIATEDKGTAELIEKISAYRHHIESSGKRNAKKVGLWKQRLLDLLEARMMERIVQSGDGERELEALASQVSERKKDPYTAVDEILARAGLR